jgi:hypothetical protein
VVLMICYRRGSAMMAIVDAVRSSMADCGGGSCVGGVALRSRSECAHLADFEVFCRSKDETQSSASLVYASDYTLQAE